MFVGLTDIAGCCWRWTTIGHGGQSALLRASLKISVQSAGILISSEITKT